MAVKIRLRRMGAKKNPFYRIVVADSRAPRDGRFIEELGYYEPLSKEKNIKVDAGKVQKWIQNGAKPTTTVDRLFKANNVYAGQTESSVEETSEEVTEEVEEAEEA